MEAEGAVLLPVATYTAEAEAVHVAVTPEPVETEVAVPEESISEWMTGMGHADLASATRAVREWGFTDLSSVKQVSVADIDEMLVTVKLDWVPLHQRRFRRKWEEMQV